MTIRSMTAFASAQGSSDQHSWSWELRSVNAKGLDLRLRVPDWLEGLENNTRAALAKALARGNVSLTLRITRTEDSAGQVQVNTAVLQSVVKALGEAQSMAKQNRVEVRAASAAELLSFKGVLEQSAGDDDPAPLVAALGKELETLVAEFVQMREAEGAALAVILNGQLEQVAALTALAAERADERKAKMAETLKANLARVMDNADGADPDRVAQELALIAVKADVTEELDRLGAHVAAARDLLVKGGAVGRKLDFLMQEFNREANTLCSKAQNSGLTAVGLELKTVIDQMREQVQNIE
ncbi:YicC family protein [Leisingera aquaemixtae]|uniref:YicC/YloC family endoribonuclease n=1 Tax=Leisingera TaxID=191028 RepID=UPI001C940668|nr:MULTISPECIES: YicC/YloC family endoribonuclease [Leisingera]MBY6065618.1 YicC family protein [Leisingera aquaemixtae]MCB4454164.1 YicC family protein [Leisingera sp. McT4-56]